MDVSGNENVVHMDEVLQSIEEEENDLLTINGDVNEDKCTYDEGYRYRQPIFACRTCMRLNKPSGICLGCRKYCHRGHDIIELYTKRNFRCDCGNSKFQNFTCSLNSNKDSVNNINKYDQNFSGLYCICSSEYNENPNESMEDQNPIDSQGNDMLQCIICEDWFHCKHLVGYVAGHDFDELICQNCSPKLPWLIHGNFDQKICLLNLSHISEPDSSKYNAYFLPYTWRKSICSCSFCIEFCQTNHLEFLLSDKDLLEAYANAGMKLKEENDKEAAKAFQSLDKRVQLDLVHGYKEMCDKLKDYLGDFAKSNKVVSKEDIENFFSNIRSN